MDKHISGMKITIPHGGLLQAVNPLLLRAYGWKRRCLWGIANNGVSISALENANNLYNATIHPGQTLKIQQRLR